MFSIPSSAEIIILATQNLSSAIAFNVVKVRILSLGKELTYSLIHHFETHSQIPHFLTVPNSKKLQTTTKMWLLTHSHTTTPFDAPGKQAFKNTVGKGEIARNEQFLLFPQCFLPVWIAFCHFHQI